MRYRDYILLCVGFGAIDFARDSKAESISEIPVFLIGMEVSRRIR